MERQVMYTDEKRPDGEIIYIQEVTDLEAAAPAPKLSPWRRISRIILTVCMLGFLLNAFGSPMPKCARKHASVIGLNDELDKPKMDYSWDKSIQDFKIEQGSLSKLPSLTDVYGKVILAGDDKAENINVRFEINVSDDGLWKKIRISPGKKGIYFAADALSLVKQSVNITAFVTVPAKKDYKLNSFKVETKALNIKLLDSFNTIVNKTYFETVSGNITSYGGDLKDVEMSAYVMAKSVSGNIYGRFGLGKALALKTVSGNIGANITDAPFEDRKAKLSTDTVSGETRIQFANGLHAHSLQSRHLSTGGNLYCDYPEEWQGHMKATSVTGHIRFVGKGVQITKKENSASERLLKALKGDGSSYVFLHSTAADINLAFAPNDQADPPHNNPDDGEGAGMWF